MEKPLKKRKRMMEKLHEDIILNILLRLPHQSIVNCKLVCKPWRDLLGRHTKPGLLFLVGTQRFCRFNQLCYARQQYDDTDVHGHYYSYKTLAKFDALPDCFSELVASCNGLVCISVEHDLIYDPIYICNPNTGEFVYLPKYIFCGEDYDGGGHEGSFISGFGYTYRTDEYKVVRMYTSCGYPASGLSLKVQVFTLGSGLGWRDKGRADFFLSITSVCANGALHWIEMKKRKIVAFDLADEKFVLIPLPSVFSPAKILGEVTLSLLGGYLSVSHVVKEAEGAFINIWSLKKKRKCNRYDMGEDEFDNYWHWSKEFRIPRDYAKAKYSMSYQPLAVTESNQVLLWRDGVVFCYDSITTTLAELWDDHPRLWVEASPHLNSLVSLEALGEKSSKRI